MIPLFCRKYPTQVDPKRPMAFYEASKKIHRHNVRAIRNQDRLRVALVVLVGFVLPVAVALLLRGLHG